MHLGCVGLPPPRVEAVRWLMAVEVRVSSSCLRGAGPGCPSARAAPPGVWVQPVNFCCRGVKGCAPFLGDG